MGDALAAVHRERFDERYRLGRAPDDPVELWTRMLQTPETAEWTDPVRPGDARLELRVFGDWTVGFAEGPGGALQLEWPLGRAELGDRVARIRAALRDGEGPEVQRWLQGLDDLLIAPFARVFESAERLYVSADGPLQALPFAALHDEAGWLAERFHVAMLRPADPPRFARESADAPGIALIVGDAATSGDLRIGRVVDVDVRYGPDTLSLETAGIVHLVGPLAPGPAVCLRDEGPATPVSRVTDALTGALCATVMGPVEGTVGRDAVAALLPGVRGGVLARRWAADDQSLLLGFYARAAKATDAAGLVSALGEARQVAIREGLPPHVWAAFELHLSAG